MLGKYSQTLNQRSSGFHILNNFVVVVFALRIPIPLLCVVFAILIYGFQNVDFITV